jgi:TonB family protein
MSAHVEHPGALSGRSMVVLATVALHALLIAALMSVGVIHVGSDVHAPSLQAWVIEDPKPSVFVESETPTDKSLDHRTLTLDVPMVKLPDESPVEAPVAPPVQQVAAPDAGAVSTPPASTELSYRAVRSPDEFYPASSIRLDEQGSAIVRVCVGAQGEISGMPTVASSSGSPRLDAAAVSWALEALRFTPATSGGAPVLACKGFRVKFTLH